MSQEGRGCLVSDQVVQTKLHNLKSRVGGPDPQFLHWIRACNCSQRVWKENGILSFINLFFFFCFLGTFILYKQCIKNNNTGGTVDL